MKIIYLPAVLTFFLISQCITAQTYRAETENFTRRYNNGEFDIYEYQKIAKKWKRAIENVNGYPELPYSNELKDVHYEFIFTFDSLDKNIIYNRILEWASLRYTALGSVLDYQDYELGKIIIKGKNPIRAYSSDRLYYLNTYKFTIVDNRVRLEVFKISYDYEFNEFRIDETIFYNYTANHPIGKYFPVSNMKNIYWEEKMNILKNTDKDIKDTATKMEQFISVVDKDYIF